MLLEARVPVTQHGRSQNSRTHPTSLLDPGGKSQSSSAIPVFGPRRSVAKAYGEQSCSDVRYRAGSGNPCVSVVLTSLTTTGVEGQRRR